jgi:zinc and cadmium transporter
MFLNAILAGVVVMLVSLSGVVFLSQPAKTFLEKRLSFLVAFSAGVFLVVAISLAREVYELGFGIIISTLLIAFGYLVASLLYKLLPESHHHHDDDCHESHQAAVKVLVGSGIHHIADGLVIATAFVTNPVLGLVTTLSIVIHESLQEISKFFVLQKAGFAITRALLINFAVSGTILIGITVGYFGMLSSSLQTGLLALGSGFFFHIFINDLYPKRSVYAKSSDFYWHLVLVALGIVMMAIVTELASHFSPVH